MISIVILNRYRLVREALSGYLAGQPGFCIDGAVGSEAEACELTRAVKPRILVVDTDTALDVFVLHALHRACALSKIVIITPSCSPKSLERLGYLGVRASVSVDSSLDELWKAILAVIRGEQYCSPAGLANSAFGENEGLGVTELTNRQLQIAGMLRIGKTSAEIGIQLGISPKTIEVHRRNILKILGCKNTVHLAAKLTTSAFAVGAAPLG